MSYVKIRFSAPEKGDCIGKKDEGTCLECLQRFPEKIACSSMGEYLDDDMWNKCIGSGPQYIKDYKVREADEFKIGDGDKTQKVDKFGRFKGANKNNRKQPFGRRVA